MTGLVAAVRVLRGIARQRTEARIEQTASDVGLVHPMILAALIVILLNGPAAGQSSSAHPDAPQATEPSATPAITAADVIDEWEKLGASPEWANTFPWSPKNPSSRLEFARLYLAVGKVSKVETLMNEQIGRLTEPYVNGVFRPRAYELLRLEAAVCRAKNDTAGTILYRNLAWFTFCREIEKSYVGTVLFPQEYQRRRAKKTPDESADAFLLAVLEAVEKRVPEASGVANDRRWQEDVENNRTSTGHERARQDRTEFRLSVPCGSVCRNGPHQKGFANRRGTRHGREDEFPQLRGVLQSNARCNEPPRSKSGRGQVSGCLVSGREREGTVEHPPLRQRVSCDGPGERRRREGGEKGRGGCLLRQEVPGPCAARRGT